MAEDMADQPPKKRSRWGQPSTENAADANGEFLKIKIRFDRQNNLF